MNDKEILATLDTAVADLARHHQKEGQILASNLILTQGSAAIRALTERLKLPLAAPEAPAAASAAAAASVVPPVPPAPPAPSLVH